MDCYKTSRVQTELHLSRENLVGLAVLLGCDYIPKVATCSHIALIQTVSAMIFCQTCAGLLQGIQGVGKEQALKLIRLLNGQTLLQW